MKAYPVLAVSAALALALTACSSTDQKAKESPSSAAVSSSASTSASASASVASASPRVNSAQEPTVGSVPAAVSDEPTWGTVTTSSAAAGAPAAAAAESTGAAAHSGQGGANNNPKNPQAPAEKIARAGESCGSVQSQNASAVVTVQNGAVVCDRALTVMQEYVSTSAASRANQTIQDAQCSWNEQTSSAECTAVNGAVKFTAQLNNPASQRQGGGAAPAQPSASPSTTVASELAAGAGAQ